MFSFIKRLFGFDQPTSHILDSDFETTHAQEKDYVIVFNEDVGCLLAMKYHLDSDCSRRIYTRKDNVSEMRCFVLIPNGSTYHGTAYDIRDITSGKVYVRNHVATPEEAADVIYEYLCSLNP